MEDYNRQIDAARKAHGPTRYRKGYDGTKPGGSRMTFGIDVGTFDPTSIHYGQHPPADSTTWHRNQIEVHGDAALRDRILGLLQQGAKPRVRVKAKSVDADGYPIEYDTNAQRGFSTY